MNTALMPLPRPTFLDASGKPLSGGQVFFYAAGTSTPQTAYTDASGTTALPNPVVLDASGSASIWLGPSAYKLVLQDATGVQQWSADNVSSVSQAQISGSPTFTTVTVEGGENVGGDLTVDGNVSASSVSSSGTMTAGGTLTAAAAIVNGATQVNGAATLQSLEVTGAATLDGALNVSGLATFASAANVKIGSQLLAAYLGSLIPAQAGVTTRTDTGYFIVKLPLAGSGYVEVGFGSGTVANGATIPLPPGFAYTQMASLISPHDIRANSSNNSDSLSLEQNTINSDGSITMWQQGTSGQRWPVSGAPSSQSANWLAIIWRTL